MKKQICLKNLLIKKKIYKPFPIIIYSNLLSENQIAKLKKTLSNKNCEFDKTVMGNRKTILKGSLNFKKLVRNDNIAKKIDHFFEDEKVFNFFLKNLNEINKKKYFFPSKKKSYFFLKDYIRQNQNIIFKIKNKLLKLYSYFLNQIPVYCDFDFSVAGKGYEREPHHDNDHRILVFLFYMNSVPSSSGGQLTIFGYKKKPKIFYRQPDPKLFSAEHILASKKGTLITFLSTPDSIHGVKKIIKKNSKRYFFYGSYTSIKKIDWFKNF